MLLIPRYGALGAAVGLACAMVANNLLPLVQVGRAARLHPFGRGHAGRGRAVGRLLRRTPRVVSPRSTGAGPAGLTLATVVAVPAFAAGAWLLRDRSHSTPSPAHHRGGRVDH